MSTIAKGKRNNENASRATAVMSTCYLTTHVEPTQETQREECNIYLKQWSMSEYTIKTDITALVINQNVTCFGFIVPPTSDFIQQNVQTGSLICY
jgi:hypothetical protein